MRPFVGRYVNAELLREVVATRRWRWTSVSASHSEIILDADGNANVITNWHEAGPFSGDSKDWSFACFETLGKDILLRFPNQPNPSKPIHFRRIPWGAGESDDAYYFDLLFKGCFLDQSRGQWCFTTKKVTVDGKAFDVSMELDIIGLLENATVLRLKGNEDEEWMFSPRVNGGWLLVKHDLKSPPDEGYERPDWSKPWKTLTPIK